MDTSCNEHRFFSGAVVVVTGGAGSVGSELVKQLLDYDVSEVRSVDTNESALFEQEHQFHGDTRLHTYRVDITCESENIRVFSGADFVFHCAALKHVPSCERSPYGAVDVNILGLGAVTRAAQFVGIKRLLFTSSDKAVNPTNVMGASKLMGERLIAAADATQPHSVAGKTICSSTRFGNVAGSRGSVIPLFVEQMKRGGRLTLTDERMTRFFMTLQDATFMVLQSIVHAKGGEIFITKMPVINIRDLAEVMIDMLAPIFGRSRDHYEIEEVGCRPGEKLWEELSTSEEARRQLEGEGFLCVLPVATQNAADSEEQYTALRLRQSGRAYVSSSEPSMSREEIWNFLLLPGVLPDELRESVLEVKQQPRVAAV